MVDCFVGDPAASFFNLCGRYIVTYEKFIHVREGVDRW